MACPCHPGCKYRSREEHRASNRRYRRRVYASNREFIVALRRVLGKRMIDQWQGKGFPEPTD